MGSTRRGGRVRAASAVILYGRNPVKEALRGRRKHAVKEVWATAGVAREPWLEGTRVKSASAEEVQQRCGSTAHQGICAEAGGYPYCSAAELLAGTDPLVVALDQVQDPQNLGSICRTAECAGVAGVVIAERRAAEVTPAVCKASAGAVEHLHVARVRNLADFRGSGVVLVLGSEGAGLRPRVAGACDELIALPLLGRIESLNVSAAAAVM